MASEFAPARSAARLPQVPGHPHRPLHERRLLRPRTPTPVTKVWVMAGRTEDVAAPGDYMTFDDLGLPMLSSAARTACCALSTTPASTVGRPSCGTERGTARNLRCQYHSWTYDITHGQLIQVPDERDFVGLSATSGTPSRSAVRSGRAGSSSTRTRTPRRCTTGSARPSTSSTSWRATPYARSRLAASSCRATGRSPPRRSSRCTTSATSTRATAASPLDNRGATMGLLPNGCSRMITPFSVAAARPRDAPTGPTGSTSPPHRSPTSDSVSDVVRSTSTAYACSPT